MMFTALCDIDTIGHTVTENVNCPNECNFWSLTATDIFSYISKKSWEKIWKYHCNTRATLYFVRQSILSTQWYQQSTQAAGGLQENVCDITST